MCPGSAGNASCLVRPTYRRPTHSALSPDETSLRPYAAMQLHGGTAWRPEGEPPGEGNRYGHTRPCEGRDEPRETRIGVPRQGIGMTGLEGLRGHLERKARRARVPQDPPRARLDIAAIRLDGEFGEFDVTICRARGGYALAAQRRDAGEAGLYAVVTPDPDEMRRLLNEDSPPGAEGNAAPGGD